MRFIQKQNNQINTSRVPGHALSLASRLALLLALLAVLAFLWLARVTTMPQVVTLNEDLVRRVYMLRTPVLDAVMLLFTRAGNPWVVAGLLVTLALVLLWLRRWSDIVGVAVAGGGAWFLTETLKHYYQRARPALVPTPLEVSSSSFPSAHALGAMVGYGILLFVGWRVLRRRWLLLVPPGIIMLIGISRVYFGVHFLTDVLAGFLVGLAWLLVSARVVWMIDGSRFDDEL